MGKPEALKGDSRGFWSRRINDEHRLVYTITNEYIIVNFLP
ncbi:MAG: type II toxin-antitoxin system YoeB family toxin [Parafilimonas sp.]